MGYSFCRFVCGIADWDMGSADFCDGDWLWPEGLAHYVEKHSVRLPDEFIECMRLRSWQPPRAVDVESGNKLVLRAIGYWCSRFEPTLPDPRALVQPGWYGNNLPRITSYLRGAERVHLGFEPYKSFWVTWAKVQSPTHPLPTSGDVPIIHRDWLVRPITFDDFLFSEGFDVDMVRKSYFDQLRAQVEAALAQGGELWKWYSGGIGREGGAAMGLAIIQDGVVLWQWWVWPGALSDYANCSDLCDEPVRQPMRGL
jgi:hypothetical protein